MELSQFDFELDPALIAQRPADRRDRSRLLVLPRNEGPMQDLRFDTLPELLRRGDLLVVNDVRVVPARLIGRKSSGGRVELLLLEPLDSVESRSCAWRCLVRASRTPSVGSELQFRGLRAELLSREAENWTVRLSAEGAVGQAIEEEGYIPLPPYVRRDPSAGPDPLDRERYQTVFARTPGAVAAPTAGLHFTDELLEALKRSGIELGHVTLHVGPGTFQPVRTARVEDHRMHAERFELGPELAAAIGQTRQRGGRVVAVGTTVARTLEHCATDDGGVQAGRDTTALFIYPGFRFRVVDALITNFHLPRSTLIMMVAAFAGLERTLSAYRHAVARGYRFYSYGDAMYIGD